MGKQNLNKATCNLPIDEEGFLLNFSSPFLTVVVLHCHMQLEGCTVYTIQFLFDKVQCERKLARSTGMLGVTTTSL